MGLSELRTKIDDRTARLAVVGLGYVGLAVSAVFAEAGFDVLGVELRPERVESINEGVVPLSGNEPGLADLLAEVVKAGRLHATGDYANLKDRDVVLIAVETPVDENHVPRYDALRAVLTGLGPVMKAGTLVIVESTLAPGTMDNVVRPRLEEASSGKQNQDFYLGHCPERVMPGRLLKNLRTVSRVAGGMTPETAEAMAALYRKIVQAELDTADCVTAELVKTTENAYRDVQIAFANEVALICEAVGGDVWKVRELVNKSPGRQMHMPGAGVGGHCIPKDPWLLAHGVSDKDVPLRLIPAARAVNDSMPLHMVDLLRGALREAGRELPGARIGVLGYAYLEDSDDTRNSPSEELVRILREQGAEAVIHDPWIPEYSGDLLARIRGCDALVLMVGHSAYRWIDPPSLKAASERLRVLVDGRRLFDAGEVTAATLIHRAVGG